MKLVDVVSLPRVHTGELLYLTKLRDGVYSFPYGFSPRQVLGLVTYLDSLNYPRPILSIVADSWKQAYAYVHSSVEFCTPEEPNQVISLKTFKVPCVLLCHEAFLSSSNAQAVWKSGQYIGTWPEDMTTVTICHLYQTTLG